MVGVFVFYVCVIDLFLLVVFYGDVVFDVWYYLVFDVDFGKCVVYYYLVIVVLCVVGIEVFLGDLMF